MSVGVKMMKQSDDGEQERSREYEKQRSCDERERNREFRKQVIGSPGEEVVSLHFGDHARTINKEEISMHEAWNQKEKRTLNETGLLQDVVKHLQEQIQALSTQSLKMQETKIDMKLLETARHRLAFDVDDVHASIASWNYFFELYGITSDYNQFLAVEQLLPAHIQRTFAVCGEVQASYVWLVTYLKNRYEPRYMCYEMANKYIDKLTNINELEDLAKEAANCPQEHLMKHFMLQSCTLHHKQRMKPFLLLPMKEFKFQLAMLMQEDVNSDFSNVAEVKSILEEKTEPHFTQSFINQKTPLS